MAPIVGEPPARHDRRQHERQPAAPQRPLPGTLALAQGLAQGSFQARKLAGGLAIAQALAQGRELDPLAEEGRYPVGGVGIHGQIGHDLPVPVGRKLAVDHGMQVVFAHIGAQVHPVHLI